MAESMMIQAKTPARFPSGDIVAVDVPAETYMELYAADYHEWIEGVVIKMSPVSSRHDMLTRYFEMLLQAYLTLNPIGVIRSAPFVMRVDAVGVRREPDVQIILKDNPGELTDTMMIGAADICIEIVSDESVTRDYGNKFEEYEKAGVREYWIIDPQRMECRFHRLNDEKHYALISPNAAHDYQTPLLPKLKLHVPTLWQDDMLDYFAIGDSVRAMFE